MCILRTAQILRTYTKDLLDRALIDGRAFVANKEPALMSKTV